MRTCTREAACLLLLLTACGGQEIFVEVEVDGSDPNQRFGSASKILAYIDGKTLSMEGPAIPSHPNGIFENLNSGQATQCYHKVVMHPQANRITINTQTGVLNGAPNVGDMGTCDRSMKAADLSFDSTAVLIENVRDNGACFDFTVTFPGFGQEGRGSIDAEGTTMVLELFFKDRAQGHRCSAGNVGDRTVTAAGAAFTGDARQTYSIIAP